MKLLIITAWYHPFIHPRAHRWTALAEYWALQGHEVHVLTGRVGGLSGIEQANKVHVHRTGFDSLKEWVLYKLGGPARGRVGVTPGPPSRTLRILQWMYQKGWKHLVFPDDAAFWYFPAKRSLKNLVKQESFDVVITVSLPFTGHLLGLWVKKTVDQRSIWLADKGDPFSFQAKAPNNPWLYSRLNRYLEKKVLETADALSLTTTETLQKYREQFGDQSVTRAKVIPPLLHPAPLSNTMPRRKNPTKFKIGYFGALYAPTRTPDAFLAVLKQLEQFRPELKTRMEIHFYGEIFPEFYFQLAQEHSIVLHGLQSRAIARQAMDEMDVLLSIGNCTDFQLPSKSVDYLGAGKPVWHLAQMENDPVKTLFKGNRLFFNCQVNGKGADMETLQALAHWLESEKPALPPSELEAWYAPYLVESIAAQYQELMSPKFPG